MADSRPLPIQMGWCICVESYIPYSIECVQVFCTMLYSSGLPILYPIAVLSFALSYWAEKWELLRLCRPTQHHQDGLAKQTGRCLCTCLLHLSTFQEYLLCASCSFLAAVEYALRPCTMSSILKLRYGGIAGSGGIAQRANDVPSFCTAHVLACAV